MEKVFRVEEYLNAQAKEQRSIMTPDEEGFEHLCQVVEQVLSSDWEKADDVSRNLRLEKEKKAMLGAAEEVSYYKERIRDILREKKIENCWHPPWYRDLTEGVFSELYGLAGLTPWAYDETPEYRESSSAKLIGDRLYCLIDGKAKLQPQRIKRKRREQLKRTLLLATPKERIEYGFHEVYLHNGIRITIYSGERTKEGQDIMVFRKYIIRELSFENMISLGTIPEGSDSLFKLMVTAGFNVIFSGQVRSGKTTFLQTWQSYESTELEGVAVATDPETPWHLLMSKAPIMQLVADGVALENMTRSLLRGDNDYILLEEMRDAVAFKLALDITSTGTCRSKATIHDSNPINVPYKMAAAIRDRYGGDLRELIGQVYKNFDYIFGFTQDTENRSHKILTEILALAYDYENDRICAQVLCKYNPETHSWYWSRSCDEDRTKRRGVDVNLRREIKAKIDDLSEVHPLMEEMIVPGYYRGGSS